MINLKIFVNNDLIHCASLKKYTTVQKFGVSIIFLCFWKKSLMLTKAAYI